MDIKIPNTASTALPTGVPTKILVQGAETYTGQRAGQPAKLVLDDKILEVTPTSVEIGPLLNFLNDHMPGAGTHYAQKTDGRDVIDALEAMYPKDPKAIDPRTIYSRITVHLPTPMIQPLRAA